MAGIVVSPKMRARIKLGARHAKIQKWLARNFPRWELPAKQSSRFLIEASTVPVPTKSSQVLNCNRFDGVESWQRNLRRRANCTTRRCEKQPTRGGPNKYR